MGEEAQAARSMLDIIYPMEAGQVKHWEEMDLLWDYTWERLQLDTKHSKVLLTEPPLNPIANRVRMLQVLPPILLLCHFPCYPSSHSL